jgi:hypothetical protein
MKTDLTESSSKILTELALPASKQVGQALGNVFGLFNTVTLPIKLANDYAQRNFQKYSDKLKDIPEEKIQEVQPEIAIPLIDKLSYTSNNDLADAYASLLANASNKDKVDLVHPGFIEKINCMSPDEAKLLQLLKNKADIYYIEFRAEDVNGHFITLSYKLTGLEQELNLTPKTMSIHLENLVSLSILEDKEGMHRTNDNLYSLLIDTYKGDQEFFENNIKSKKYGDNQKLKVSKSYYAISNLGQIFIEACTNNQKDSVNT